MNQGPNAQTPSCDGFLIQETHSSLARDPQASPRLMADEPLDLLVVWNWAGQAQASGKLQLSWVMAPWAQTPHAPSLPPATITSGGCWQVGPWDVGTTM